MPDDEYDPFEFGCPGDKLILCRRCKGDPQKIVTRRWYTCPDCDGKKHLGTTQCDTCDTDGRILDERRGCTACESQGTKLIRFEDIESTKLSPGELATWQESIIGFFKQHYPGTNPTIGEPGFDREGAVVIYGSEPPLEGSVKELLSRTINDLESRAVPFGLVCYFRGEEGAPILQILPPEQ